MLQHSIRREEHHIIALLCAYHALNIAVYIPVLLIISPRVSGSHVICYEYPAVFLCKRRPDIYSLVIRAVRQHLHVIPDGQYRSREKYRCKPLVKAGTYICRRLHTVELHHKSSIGKYLIIHDIILIHNLRNVKK